jgi:hypothetical protein
MRILFRIAAAVALVQGFAHGYLVVADRPIRGGETIFAAMHAPLAFHGAVRSYWGFLYGYGLFAAFTCLVESALLLFAPSRAVAAVLLAANLGYASVVALYFFPVPLFFDLLLIALLAGALVLEHAGRAGREGARARPGAGRGAAQEAAR